MIEVLDTSILNCVQEAERRRIARDLHDGVVQSLTALLADLGYYLAGSALNFEAARTAIHQVLAVKPGPRGASGLPLRRPDDLRVRAPCRANFSASLPGSSISLMERVRVERMVPLPSRRRLKKPGPSPGTFPTSPLPVWKRSLT